MILSLATYNRFDILKRSLDSLAKTKWGSDDVVVISDDNSEDEVKNYLKMVNIGTEKDLIIHEKRNGCGSNNLYSFRYAFNKYGCEYVMNIDSDAIYNPEWLNKIKEAKESLCFELAGLSCFNCVTTHNIISDVNEFVNKKDHLGGFCSLINRTIIYDDGIVPVLRKEWPRGWDWKYIEIANRLGLNFYCTKKSYAQHIGYEGASVTGGGYYDQALDFVGE